eukprot:4452370-Prymnesium_polylepis.3
MGVTAHAAAAPTRHTARVGSASATRGTRNVGKRRSGTGEGSRNSYVKTESSERSPSPHPVEGVVVILRR